MVDISIGGHKDQNSNQDSTQQNHVIMPPGPPLGRTDNSKKDQSKYSQQQQKKSPGQISPEAKKLMEDLGNVSVRLRLMEERYNNLKRKSRLSEQNLIRIEKDFNDEIKTIMEEINDARKEFGKIKERIEIMEGKLDDYASSNDLKILAKYIEFIDPTKYISKHEAERMINEVISQLK